MTENNYTTMKMKGMTKRIFATGVLAVLLCFGSYANGDFVLDLDGNDYRNFQSIQFLPGKVILVSEHPRTACFSEGTLRSDDPIVMFDDADDGSNGKTFSIIAETVEYDPASKLLAVTSRAFVDENKPVICTPPDDFITINNFEKFAL